MAFEGVGNAFVEENCFSAGRTWVFWAGGWISSTQADLLDYALFADSNNPPSTIIQESIGENSPPAADRRSWLFKAYMTCRETGPTGRFSITGQLVIEMDNQVNPFIQGMNVKRWQDTTGDYSIIDTTVPNYFLFASKWQSGGSGDTFNISQAGIYLLP